MILGCPAVLRLPPRKGGVLGYDLGCVEREEGVASDWKGYGVVVG